MADRIGWSNFPTLRDFDNFAVIETTGTPGEINITLQTNPRVTWWKSIKFVEISSGRILLPEAQMQDSDHGPRSIRIATSDYSRHKFVIAKAKIFGIHTDMYELFELSEKDGRNISLTWQTDGPNNWLDAIGSFFSDIGSGFVNGVVTVVNAIVTVVESVVSFITNAIMWVVGLILAIPVIGRIIGMIINYVGWLIGTIINAVLDLLFAFLGILGVRQPEKLLRLVIVVQQDESGNPVATLADIQGQLDLMIRLYKERANIKVIPFTPFNFYTPFSSSGPLSAQDFTVFLDRPSLRSTLDVNCGASAFGDNLLTTGSQFELMINNLFWGNTRRIVGYGAPIYAFAVRSFIGGGSSGCSLWATTNYVTVQFSGAGAAINSLAHESGHACNLSHTSDPASNLMLGSVLPTLPPTLEDGQVTLMRLSNHCTYS
jgi:hypothetical protein